MPTDPTHLDPAHAELLAKAKAALGESWLTKEHMDFVAAANPAAIIDLITLLGEARAALADLRQQVLGNDAIDITYANIVLAARGTAAGEALNRQTTGGDEQKK